ncbi:MAG: GNAT family N-acetyltransferase [Defluviitaleaceae bacterium]|nr:GNAT family N-acetyltransferase [Defluviitaleaceae bacterium]
MNYSIQKSVEADAPEILRLQYAAYQSEAEIHNDFTIQPLTQTLDEVLMEYQKGVVLKAERDGKIIGSVRAYADGDTVYVGKLIVHPSEQGKGLGKRLLAEIESEILRKRFELFTSGKSERNLHLYEQAGYTRFREETDLSGIKFVYMEKEADKGGRQ